ncbi:CarD family transcriptional regulator [Halalkalibacter nanhaiisediminis]|uniref:CarD family transcriptional regulator n=1 Tax=Halalkalibacter nanhaiisediminis TaxID=688079 RepID=A0A562QTC0_9BACI|nr:CarD family transcriptional regulator [Halalkalibacter nanhaiisediminis]TWI59326.1 CarD family transcriptional regulator [Halalkalibacter nanhaiisediminis]
MFEIGNNIIYPMHGAGIIVGIEEKEIQGEVQNYYVIKIITNNMQVLIPINNITNSHIRAVADKLSMEVVLDIFHNGETDKSLSWKHRYKINSEKIKSGKLKEGAEVVRDLMRIENEKNLNSSDKQLLNTARKILVGELRLIRGISEVQATDLLKINNPV